MLLSHLEHIGGKKQEHYYAAASSFLASQQPKLLNALRNCERAQEYGKTTSKCSI